MLLQVFSIFDSAVMTWRSPIFTRAKGEILRSFVEAVNRPDTDFAKHPEDYTLFELGTWDDDKCLFSLLKTPIPIAKAIELLKPVAK